MSVPTVSIDGVPDPLPQGLNVVDVREREEWDAGHVAGSQHLPLSQLIERVGEMPEGQTLVVCKVGGRSAQAVGWLAAQGHDVVNLHGGLLAWEDAERPLVDAAGAPGHVLV